MKIKSDWPIIGIDIDGTLRDFGSQVERYIERDYPDSINVLRSMLDKKYRFLEELPCFDTKEESIKWMYEERPFEIFALAPRMHTLVMDNLNIFSKAAEKSGFNVVLSTVQSGLSVSATYQWLAKWGCKVQNLMCFNSINDKLESGIDIFLDDSPELIQKCMVKFPSNLCQHPIIRDETVPRIIKVKHGYNEDLSVPSIDIAGGEFNKMYEFLKIDKIL